MTTIQKIYQGKRGKIERKKKKVKTNVIETDFYISDMDSSAAPIKPLEAQDPSAALGFTSIYS